jgi:hypothetical protein
MNALKSGIDARAQIIRAESCVALQTLTTEYFDRFHPTTPEPRLLVDTLIASVLLRRYRPCEAQLWEQGVLNANTPVPPSPSPKLCNVRRTISPASSDASIAPTATTATPYRNSVAFRPKAPARIPGLRSHVAKPPNPKMAAFRKPAAILTSRTRMGGF